MGAGLDSSHPAHGIGASGASLADILTAIRSLNSLVGALGQSFLQVNGNINAAGLTTTQLVKGAPGRLCVVSVIVAGSASGKIYDTTNTSATTAPVFVIPMTIGVTVLNFPMQYGIVVAPGTGQTVSVSYS